MDYRALRIIVWLVFVALLAIFVVGASASPAPRQDEQDSFRIATTGVSDVMTQDITPEIARYLNMCEPRGVVVTDVVYSPLQPGDVIVAVNGNPVSCQAELNEQLGQLGSAETFTISVLRDDAIRTIPIQRAMAVPGTTCLVGTVEARGMSVASLPTENGVFITDVRIGTVASDIGLKSGDIILDVDGHRVHSAAEFQELLGQLGNRQATFNVRQRNGQVNVFTFS